MPAGLRRYLANCSTVYQVPNSAVAELPFVTCDISAGVVPDELKSGGPNPLVVSATLDRTPS
jgi:hypothetical protein